MRAIEQEDLTRLPELAYVRGFLRSYARVLNIDPAPILTDLNAKLAPVIVGRCGSSGRLLGDARHGTRTDVTGWVIALALIGLIVLGVLGWHATRSDAQVQTAPVAPAPVVVAPVVPLATTVVPEPAPAPAAPATDATASTVTAGFGYGRVSAS